MYETKNIREANGSQPLKMNFHEYEHDTSCLVSMRLNILKK
jgi:hypothetical protein